MDTFLKVTPESVGISSRSLLGMMEDLGKLEYLNSIVLLRHGKVCLECYLAPYRREVPHQLFSLSKSFTSCAIGLAQAEGRLRITDKLISFFPEYEEKITDPGMKKVTLQDLLTMRSGHKACATKYMFGREDYVEAFLASPLDMEPGTTFVYNSAASYMLSAVIRKVTGENVREYLMERLFTPLRITPGIWECCPRGINLGGWGLSLTTGDLAKFAQLLLQHGVWEGKQILPAEYLAEATRIHSDNSMNEKPDWRCGYGYQFWVSQHGYRGDGAAGQLAVVLEEQDLCIAVTSCLTNMQDLLDIFWKDLLPCLNETPLPEDPESYQALQNFLKEMKIPVPVSEPIPELPSAIQFSFQENTAGITQCTLSFQKDHCSMTFLTSRGPEELRAGFGHFEYSTLQLTDSRPHPTGAYAVWGRDQILEIRSFICDGIYRDIWRVDLSDSGNAEPLTNQMLCSCFRAAKPRFLLKEAIAVNHK